MKYFNKIYLICCFLSTTVFAGTIGEETMVNLTLADGLSGETVNRIMTDHSGRVWIATTNGISTYNGKRLSSFILSDEKHLAVTVHDLCETRGRIIYAATEAGMYRLKFGERSFKKILPEVTDPECLLAVGDSIYIGGQQGLQIYDGMQLKTLLVGASRNGIDNIVRQYLKGDDGLIWFLSRYKLNSYNPISGKITPYSLNSFMKEDGVLSQFAFARGKLFVGTKGQGLYVCDLKNGTGRRLREVGNIVMTVQKSCDGKICVSTDGSGAFLIDPKTEAVEVAFNSQATGLNRLPTNGVYCYYRDHNGIDWFGFVRHGLAYSAHSGSLFSPYQTGTFSSAGKNVRTYLFHKHECLLGLQNGLYYVNDSTGIVKYFSSEELGGGHIVNSLIYFQGKYYIGTYDGGLQEMNPFNLSIQRQTIDSTLDKVSIGDMKVGPDGCLWIGSSNGLYIVNTKGNIRRYTEQNSHIIGGIIISITFDNKGNAWLTGKEGISLYSATSKEIVEGNFPDGFFNKQPWLRGTLGHNGNIYMRNGVQTFYTDENMLNFGELRLPFHYADKWCRAFLDDRNGHYWVASAKGLFRFDYDLRNMLHFGPGEGLKGDFISDMSIDGEGVLWVATSSGLFKMHPQEIEKWMTSQKYKVQLYNIRLGSDLLGSTDEFYVNENQLIRLRWNLTPEALQSEVVLTDYARQSGRLYEYRIDNGDWRVVADGETMALRNLFLGSHQLEVRLAGAKGTASIYKIIVVPSSWAIVELILLLVAVGLLWLWYRYRKTTKVLLSERDEIEDALIEAQEELETVANENIEKKYQKVKIDEAECEEIVKRMKDYIEKNKIYTNVDLKMKDLADVLHLSAPKLSQVFNLYLKENYYDVINRYRLEEFKRLIKAGEYKRFTITALSERCGFKKSSFFSTFRKIEGMTPAEYLKKMGIKS